MYYGFFDGACQGNPGPIGLGVSICDDKGEIAVGAGPVPHGTNNDAEYLAVIKLLESSLSLGIKDLVAYGDSQLIINQINGKWQAGEKFRPLLSKIEALKKQFRSVSFFWVARDRNKRADALSKRGLELNEWMFSVKERASQAVEHHESTEQVNSIAGADNTPLKAETGSEREVRIGKKYAVFVYSDKTVFFGLMQDKCSCGQADCEHRQFLKRMN